MKPVYDKLGTVILHTWLCVHRSENDQISTEVSNIILPKCPSTDTLLGRGIKLELKL